jgi:hypothetical protein
VPAHPWARAASGPRPAAAAPLAPQLPGASRPPCGAGSAGLRTRPPASPLGGPARVGVAPAAWPTRAPETRPSALAARDTAGPHGRAPAGDPGDRPRRPLTGRVWGALQRPRACGMLAQASRARGGGGASQAGRLSPARSCGATTPSLGRWHPRGVHARLAHTALTVRRTLTLPLVQIIGGMSLRGILRAKGPSSYPAEEPKA